VAPGVPLRFQADATRLRQVLLNLLGNAGRYKSTVPLRCAWFWPHIPLRCDLTWWTPVLVSRERRATRISRCGISAIEPTPRAGACFGSRCRSDQVPCRGQLQRRFLSVDDIQMNRDIAGFFIRAAVTLSLMPSVGWNARNRSRRLQRMTSMSSRWTGECQE
jgi:hypothetical protein